LLTSQLPTSYLLNAHSQYQLHLLPVTFTPTQQLPSQCSLSLPTVFYLIITHLPTANLSVLTLSTNCICYLLTSHLPKSYLLNARSLYKLYILLVNFKPSQQLPSRCSLSVPTFFYLLTSHLPKVTLSKLALTTKFTCYLHTFPTLCSQCSISVLTVILTFTHIQQLPNSYPLNAHSQYPLYLLILTSHSPNSYPLDSRYQYQLYLLPVTFTSSQNLPSLCSLSVPTVPLNFYLHNFPTSTPSMLALITNCNS